MKIKTSLVMGIATLTACIFDISMEMYGFAVMMGACSIYSFYEYYKELE